MTTPNRRDLLRAGAAGLGAAAALSATAAPAESAERSFHFDHVLGTSLDVWVVGPASAVSEAEAAALGEIERLRKVFSLHDPDSELSRLNRAAGPFAASADLLFVLNEFTRWHGLTGGALNAQVGGLTRAWDLANGAGPDAAALARTVQRIQSAGWTTSGHVVTRHTDQPFNLNSVAKGYILGKTADAVKRVAGVTAGLVNLGGDMAAFGDHDWTLGVQDPFAAAENAPPLTRIRLKNQAAATSGGYMRHYTANGRRHSHILDPRTGRPADAVAGATVIADDSTTANALATALCVLGAEGLKLAESLGLAALVIDADGKEDRTALFANFELPELPTGDEKKTEDKKDDKKKDEPKGDPWPADFQVTLNFELPTPGGRARRPYVAFWIENADGKAVRTVAVWGSSPKWLPTMSGWWKVGKDDKELCKAVCKATRAPGKYELVWDGKDDAGKPLPQGTYTVKLEVHREHGKDETQTGKIECGAKAAELTLEKKTEVGESTVKYAKKEKKEKDK